MDFNNYFYKKISLGVPIKYLFSGVIFDIFSGKIPEKSSLPISDSNELLCRITYNGLTPIQDDQVFNIKLEDSEDLYFISFNNFKIFGDKITLIERLMDILPKINNSFEIPQIPYDTFFNISQLDDLRYTISIINTKYSPIIITYSSNIIIDSIIKYPRNIINFANTDNYLTVVENNFGVCIKSGIATFFRIHTLEDDQSIFNDDNSLRCQGTIGNGVFYDISMNSNLVESNKIYINKFIIKYR